MRTPKEKNVPKELPQPSGSAAVLADSILNTRKTLTTKPGQVDRRKLGLMIDAAAGQGGGSVASLLGLADDILAMRDTIGTKAGRKNRQTMAEYIWNVMQTAQVPQEASQPADLPDEAVELPRPPEAAQPPVEVRVGEADGKLAVRSLSVENTWEIEGLVRKSGGLVQEASRVQNLVLLFQYLAGQGNPDPAVLRDVVGRCRHLRAAAGDLADSLISESKRG
jgi:hypothetical protein